MRQVSGTRQVRHLPRTKRGNLLDQALGFLVLPKHCAPSQPVQSIAVGDGARAIDGEEDPLLTATLRWPTPCRKHRGVRQVRGRGTSATPLGRLLLELLPRIRRLADQAVEAALAPRERRGHQKQDPTAHDKPRNHVQGVAVNGQAHGVLLASAGGGTRSLACRASP